METSTIITIVFAIILVGAFVTAIYRFAREDKLKTKIHGLWIEANTFLKNKKVFDEGETYDFYHKISTELAYKRIKSKTSRASFQGFTFVSEKKKLLIYSNNKGLLDTEPLANKFDVVEIVKVLYNWNNEHNITP